VARVSIGGSTIVRISRAAFCKIHVISVFGHRQDPRDFSVWASAKDCIGIFLPWTSLWSFWMMGVVRDTVTFLANALMKASLVSGSFRRLE